MAINIAITITEVPYEVRGSPRFLLYSMKLITITGPSGAGKDTVARMLSEMSGYKVLCSYTTRPKREGEIDGVEHHFVDKCNIPHDKMLAYTQYGGYEYWVAIEQVKNKSIYVIDEDGLKALCKRFPNIELFKICVAARESTRLYRGVSQERMDRDKQRRLMPLSFYDAVIFNNDSLSELRDEVQRVRYMIV
ncbi:MAG: guanylate kinase [Prevotella sp.]|nr:guanylate kinase [Prevotella sp.]